MGLKSKSSVAVYLDVTKPSEHCCVFASFDVMCQFYSSLIMQYMS